MGAWQGGDLPYCCAIQICKAAGSMATAAIRNAQLDGNGSLTVTDLTDMKKFCRIWRVLREPYPPGPHRPAYQTRIRQRRPSDTKSNAAADLYEIGRDRSAITNICGREETRYGFSGRPQGTPLQSNPVCSTRPASSRRNALARRKASGGSWVTRIIVALNSCCSSTNSNDDFQPTGSSRILVASGRRR